MPEISPQESRQRLSFFHDEELDVYVAELTGAAKAFRRVMTGESAHFKSLMLTIRYIKDKRYPNDIFQHLLDRMENEAAKGRFVSETATAVKTVLGALAYIDKERRLYA